MNIEAIKAKALQAIWPLKSVDSTFYGNRRTAAGRGLPEHYLVYFLLVDLLGFKTLGRHEKLAWSIPVELEGQVLFIEHRKLGLGVFTPGGIGAEETEPTAKEVVRLVNRGIRAARPYFDWRAEQAVNNSELTSGTNAMTCTSGLSSFSVYTMPRPPRFKRMQGKELEQTIQPVDLESAFPNIPSLVRQNGWGFPLWRVSLAGPSMYSFTSRFCREMRNR